jgi:MFS family permease
MGIVRDLVPAIAFSVVGGIGNGVQVAAVVTLLQQRTPLELQARVTGLLESINAAMPGVGFLLGGVLTAVTSAPTTYLVAGSAVLLLVALSGMFGLGGGMRRDEVGS